MEIKKEIYTVDHVTKESDDVVTLCFLPESGELMKFDMGQFVRALTVQ